MESNDELKETDIENGTYYYFGDIMRGCFFLIIFIWFFNFKKYNVDCKKHNNIALNRLYNTRSSVTCKKF